jgi:hypothetical protein
VNQLAAFTPAEPSLEVRLCTTCCSEVNTPRADKTPKITATATNKMTKAISDTRKLNFITDQGSTRATVRCACRAERFGGPLGWPDGAAWLVEPDLTAAAGLREAAEALAALDRRKLRAADGAEVDEDSGESQANAAADTASGPADVPSADDPVACGAVLTDDPLPPEAPVLADDPLLPEAPVLSGAADDPVPNMVPSEVRSLPAAAGAALLAAGSASAVVVPGSAGFQPSDSGSAGATAGRLELVAARPRMGLMLSAGIAGLGSAAAESGRSFPFASAAMISVG